MFICQRGVYACCANVYAPIAGSLTRHTDATAAHHRHLGSDSENSIVEIVMHATTHDTLLMHETVGRRTYTEASGRNIVAHADPRVSRRDIDTSSEGDTPKRSSASCGWPAVRLLQTKRRISSTNQTELGTVLSDPSHPTVSEKGESQRWS